MASSLSRALVEPSVKELVVVPEEGIFLLMHTLLEPGDHVGIPPGDVQAVRPAQVGGGGAPGHGAGR